MRNRLSRLLLLTLLLLLPAGCLNADGESGAAPTATSSAGEEAPTPVGNVERPDDYVVVATDAPSRARIFTDISEVGEVTGFDAEVMARVAEEAAFEYEFVVTSYDGLLEAVANGEFDAAMGALRIPEDPPEGIVFTDPYLEVGQVMLVLANNPLESWEALPVESTIGVLAESAGLDAARSELQWPEEQLVVYFEAPRMLEGLVGGEIDAVILDDDEAAHYAESYFQQLRVAGPGAGPAGWITADAYGIAVAENRPQLLNRLNEAIGALDARGEIAGLTDEWLTITATFNAGESLIGTPADEVVIGTTASLTGLDYAELPSPLSWEVKLNTMSGLFRYSAENELEAMLVDNFVVSEDQLQYTFTLKDDLRFPDGRAFTADDVVWSIRRSVSAGNWLVNGYLKDDDEDGFADPDAVQSLGRLSVRLRLQAPTSYFFSLLATPPYFVASQDCLPATLTPAATCGGIGPYTIAEYVPEEHVLLQANPDWPGAAPAVPNVRLRFYETSGDLQVALENERIDMAWSGLAPAEYEALADAGFATWTGPAIFKSYLVFEQSQPPWDDERVRRAVAYAVDREALTAEVFQGTRIPLYGPVPGAVPGQNPAAPERDLDEARALLAAAGYGAERPLEITLWYLNDGRYGPYEAAYADALKAQLEETGAFRVTLESEAWGVFRQQSATCNYPLYLLGWPPSDSPPRLIEAVDWMEYFITNTDSVCSNYESEAMSELLTELEAASPAPESADERFALYAAMQELWAAELPTLDLVQEPAIAAGVDAVSGVRIDAMGLMHYAELEKSVP